jgi:argininosuccinate lyase
MEELIHRNVPQRTAHEWVGKLVRKALDRGITLSELSAAELQQVDPSLDISLREALGVDRALARFQSYGSTAPAEVAKQIVAWKEKLKTG